MATFSRHVKIVAWDWWKKLACKALHSYWTFYLILRIQHRHTSRRGKRYRHHIYHGLRRLCARPWVDKSKFALMWCCSVNTIYPRMLVSKLHKVYKMIIVYSTTYSILDEKNVSSIMNLNRCRYMARSNNTASFTRSFWFWISTPKIHPTPIKTHHTPTLFNDFRLHHHIGSSQLFT